MGVFGGSGPGRRSGEARVVAITASAVLVGLFALGNLVGRSTGPVAAPEVAFDAGSPAPQATASAPASLPSPSQTPTPTPAPTRTAKRYRGSDAAAALPDPPAAGPAIAPRRVPLSMPGTGPHGTLRSTGTASVALTFDDGPDPRWTPAVLRLLRVHRVKATFCVVGVLVKAYPQLLADIAAAGHTLCNHSWDHDFGLGSRPRHAIRNDLERTNRAIRAAVPGARISYYRQPGGAWTQRVVQIATELGMSSLHWAVDPQDWRRPGAGAIAAEVSAATAEGAIVLLHDGGGERHGTVHALRTVLPDLAGRLSLEALPPGAGPPSRHGFQLPLKRGQT